MQGQRLWFVIGSAMVAAGLLMAVVGCGGGKASSFANSGRTGELVIVVDWGSSRVIPPSAVRIDVAVSGEGLRQPRTATIQRPKNSTVIRDLPVGFKDVFGEAKDNQNRTVARGQGTTTINEGQRASVDIVMSEVTPGGGTVLVRTTRGGVPANADFVAFQDGNGAWQVAQGTGGQYTLNVTDNEGRYGLAIACVVNGEVNVSIAHATTNELTEINHECGVPSQNRVTVSGTVSGLGSDEGANISMDEDFGFAYSANPNYSFQVPPGTYDLIATRGPTATQSINKVFIRRNMAVTGDTTINIDFNSADAFDPETHTAVISGVASGEEFGGEVMFLSDGKTFAWMGGGMEMVSNTFQFASIPTNRQVGNDIHGLDASAFANSTQRSVMRFFKAPMDINVTLPDPFTSPDVTTAATSPYARFTANWSSYPGAQAYVLEFGGEQVVKGRRTLLRPVAIPSNRPRPNRSRQIVGLFWSVGLSVGWLGANSTYTLPDFSGLSGWNNAWGFPAGGPVPWDVSVLASNRSLAELIKALAEERPVDGLEVRQAGKSGSITP